MSEFDKLCENLGILKRITRERYPREIKLSEEFLAALKKEYFQHKLEEDSKNVVRNRPEKFAKALRFHITHLENTAASELEILRQKFDNDANVVNDVKVKESNTERVPVVTVDGEKKTICQNDAPKELMPKKQKLCKCKKLVLKRNSSIEPIKAEIKEDATSYGNKRDNPKIELYYKGKYVATTTWARNLKEALNKYLEANPNKDGAHLRASYKKV